MRLSSRRCRLSPAITPATEGLSENGVVISNGTAASVHIAVRSGACQHHANAEGADLPGAKCGSQRTPPVVQQPMYSPSWGPPGCAIYLLAAQAVVGMLE